LALRREEHDFVGVFDAQRAGDVDRASSGRSITPTRCRCDCLGQ
jgi:hypothetical protein